jgi:hypothetical protein
VTAESGPHKGPLFVRETAFPDMTCQVNRLLTTLPVLRFQQHFGVLHLETFVSVSN